MSTTITATTSTAMILLFSLLLCFTPTCSSSGHHRHLLHQPFFPVGNTIPPLPPSLPPKSFEPKYPFSSSTPTTSTTKSFFPSSLPSPPPPPPPLPSLATFPANISSLLFPSSSSHKPISKKLIVLTISVSLLAFILLVSTFLYLFLHRKRHRHSPSILSPNHKLKVKDVSATESLRLSPQNTVASDGSFSKSPPALSKSIPSSSSTEFLYLGTLNSSENVKPSISGIKIELQSSSPAYDKLGSPELYPLPPLPRTNLYTSGEVGSSKNGNEETDYEEEDDEEFFSPRGSSGERDGLARNGSSSRRVFMPVPIVNNSGFDKSSPSSYPSSKSVSPVSSSLSNNSPLPAESVLNFPVQKLDLNTAPSLSSSTSSLRRESENSSPVRMSDVSVGNAGGGNDENVNVTRKQQFVPTRLPPPPPLPPNRILDPDSGLPILEIPSRSLSAPGSLNQNSYGLEKNEDTPRPKLKPLHWDKVRARSDRAMVWDQFKSSSFQLNEEMIETLFVVNSSNNLTPKGNAWRAMSHPFNQENRVLEPKKSQNIAILLRALGVTVDEVCEALLEGNPDMLGTELLESLLKMAPTQEEENRLREFKDQSPVKLGPAEKFLKVVLDIPFAFKRIDAILYIANFDSEIEYLSRSFETLEVACEELRNSRMFLKLLEAVLTTGNRMNVGTNRGDAFAFKLDTLLKLVDVKGADEKTTLLHFVVQEIIRAEGSRLSGTNQDVRVEQLPQSDLRDEIELIKLGLQVVSGLSGELANVKKAAAMESDVLNREVYKLVTGISKVSEVLKLSSEILPQEKYTLKFSECMEEFLKKAEQEIVKIQAQESVALSLVKELTEYFHGNSAKEEAHPFRIFMIVRDFLQILDQVCKEVGKINERTAVGFSHPYPIPSNPNVPYIFPGSNNTRQQNTSSGDEGAHSSSLVSGTD